MFLVELWKHNHRTAAQASAKVQRATAEEAVVGMLHELLARLLRSLFDGIRQLAEAREHDLDFSHVLHGNDAALILLTAQAKYGLVGGCARCHGPRASLGQHPPH